MDADWIGSLKAVGPIGCVSVLLLVVGPPASQAGAPSRAMSSKPNVVGVFGGGHGSGPRVVASVRGTPRRVPTDELVLAASAQLHLLFVEVLAAEDESA